MDDVSQILTMGACATVDAVAAGGVTVGDIAEAVIGRVAARDGEVRAFAHFDPEQVRSEAARLDSSPSRGVLHGVPVAIKDVIDTLDMPTRHNSDRYLANQPGKDAACVDILRGAGALLVGKTVTTEFAATTRGSATRNPNDLRRTPGGSSSGSAAAVADYQCAVAVGTQTGGSIIRPASYCGVFAWKPTWSEVSREGAKFFAPSNDTVGFFARSASDLLLLAETFNATSSDAPSEEDRIAICRFPRSADWAAPLDEHLDSARRALEDVGISVDEVDLDADIVGLQRAHLIVKFHEAKASFFNEYMNWPALHPEFRDMVENHEGFTANDVREAYRLLDLARWRLDDMVADYGGLLTMSAVGVAPIGLERTGFSSLNGFWTSLRMPVVNVPGLSGEADLPLGLSLVGRLHEDRRIIRVADRVHAALAASSGSR